VLLGQEKKYLPGDGVVQAMVPLNGRWFLFSLRTFTVEGGSLGECILTK